MNKSLRDLREANDEQFKPKLPQIVEEATLSEEDDFEASLLALNHLAVMADDLYSVMGGEEIKVTTDEIAAILSAYDLVSEIYDKYEQVVAMPSKEYDMDALDTEVMEEIAEELRELDEAVELVEEIEVKKQKLSWGTVITIHKGSDFSVVLHPDDQKKVSSLKAGQSVSFKDETGITWNVKLIGSQYSFHSMPANAGGQVTVNKSDLFESVQLDELTGNDNVLAHGVSGKALSVLDKLGFKDAPVGNDTWKPSGKKVIKMWGIPMRAGKWADVFFASVEKNDGWAFTIVDADGTEAYANLDQAIASLKKKAKMIEGCCGCDDEELEEAKFKFNPGKHEIIVSSKRGSDGKFSIEVQDKNTGKLLYRMRHELPNANEDGDKYTDANRIMAAKRVMSESTELEEATYAFMNKMSGKVRRVKANNDADAIKKMANIHPVSDEHMKSAGVSSVDQWFKKYYKIIKEDAQLDETPDTYGAKKSKIQASITAFQKKLDSGKYPDSEADIKKIISRLEAELKKFPGAKKEAVELDEGNLIDMSGKTCSKCGKGKYKETSQHDDMDGVLHCDKCGDKIKRWRNEIPTSKTKGGKKILSMLKKEAAGDGTILSWVSKTAKWPFKVEVLGVDGSDLVELIKKASAKSNFERAGNDAVAFKSKNEQQAAIRALEKYYKFVREQDITTYDLAVISEEFDETKFRRLATTGLVPEGDVAKAIVAMRNLDAGKELNRNQKDLITGIFHSLIGMVTGDMSVFTKIQQKLKTA